MPVVPGKKLTGTNTEISTSEVAITALVTSAIATRSPCAPSVLSSSMCRCTFSITTIASSTTSPVASVMPNSVSELIEKPKILMNANVPISDTGIVTAGMIVARQSEQEQEDHDDDDDDRLGQRGDALRGSSPNHRVVSKATT
jgi:hypothetical protein